MTATTATRSKARKATKPRLWLSTKTPLMRCE